MFPDLSPGPRNTPVNDVIYIYAWRAAKSALLCNVKHIDYTMLVTIRQQIHSSFEKFFKKKKGIKAIKKKKKDEEPPTGLMKPI